VCQGAPQEPRRPCRLRVKSRIGPPGDQRPGPRQAARPRRGANNEPSAVRPSEGNEVRPEGRQGVAALRSTGGAGELAPEDPVCEATTPTTASRERAGFGALRGEGPESLEEVARSPLELDADAVGALRSTRRALSAPAAPRRALGTSCRGESLIRGAGCLNWARPDLREPGAGNRPGPPDPVVCARADTPNIGILVYSGWEAGSHGENEYRAR
jgi:hypothetical protein